MQAEKNEAPVKNGDVLDGKYRVERVLGIGGMGVVVAARHIELNQRFAIKFMLADGLHDPEALARFQREARAAVRLKSEHTARVHDVGKLANGAPYMVMEYLTGKDLGDVLSAGGAVGVSDAVDYVLQACEAIAEAHACGIVHRDLKPRNLYLTTTIDGQPLIKVLDFGLAKTVDHLGKDRALTKSAAVMGSPQYMSPEQMKASRDVDARTDIWSLGVCLYELLTGAQPFDAETIPLLCVLVMKEQPRPLPNLRTDVPPDLVSTVMRCLEKDPNDRFADIGQLAASLEAFASPTARGSANRIRQVLNTTRLNVDFDAPDAPEAHASTFDALQTSETRTEAAFDMRPASTGGARSANRAVWAGAALGLLIGAVGLLSMGSFFTRQSRRAIAAQHNLRSTEQPAERPIASVASVGAAAVVAQPVAPSATPAAALLSASAMPSATPPIPKVASTLVAQSKPHVPKVTKPPATTLASAAPTHVAPIPIPPPPPTAAKRTGSGSF